MSESVRVLQVLGGTTLCGAESRIMDIYRNIDRTKVQFDFMVHNQNEDYYNAEIRQLGGHIYRVPRFKIVNFYSYRNAFKRFFKEHCYYQAVHGHMTSTASIYLPIAKKSGVPITIAHARSAGTDPGWKGILTKLLRSALYRKADYCLTCSKVAGEAVFGKRSSAQGKVQIIPNAIDIDRYLFAPEIRNQIREKYKLEGQFVIGHVGRFHYAKNHEFLIDIFAEIVKRQENVKLLLVGEGDLMSEVKDAAQKRGILEQVIFTGNQAKISDYYQAMDYLVFPSHFEGLPGTVVEAQAAGLKCLISDAITEEVIATDLVTAKSLRETAADWAVEVIRNQHYERSRDVEALKKSGFDVKTQVTQLEQFYLGQSKRVL